MMLAWEYPPHHVGGLGRHVFHLGHALADLGVEVTVATKSCDGRPYVWRDGDVTVLGSCPYDLHPPDFVTWAAQFNVSLLEAVTGHLSPRDFDLVHAHDWMVAYAARALKHSWGVPLVATIHATEHGRQRGLHTAMQHHISETEWWLCYEACRVITCSQYMKSEVHGIFGVPEDKIRVLPNGISESWFETVRSPDPSPLVAFIGRLVPEKGPHTAVEAMLHVLGEFPHARLVLAGDGPMEGELRRRIYQAWLGQVVEMAGRLDDQRLLDLYSRAWVAVFPSSYEPFGIVALEAMAAGTPCVVGRAGGLAEIVDHGKSGITVRPDDPLDLAQAVASILRDPALAAKLATEARKVARERYSWIDIAQGTLEVYDEALGRAGAALEAASSGNGGAEGAMDR